MRTLQQKADKLSPQQQHAASAQKNKYSNVQSANPYLEMGKAAAPFGMQAPELEAPNAWEPVKQLHVENGEDTVTWGLKEEEGDDATTLAATLGISQQEADILYANRYQRNDIRKAPADGDFVGKSTFVDVPEEISSAVNGVLTQWWGNTDDYGNFSFGTIGENYNCFECANSLARGLEPEYDETWDKAAGFDYMLTKVASNVSEGEMVPGRTLIRFAQSGTASASHAATFLNKDADGNIWVITKNGRVQKPRVMKLDDLIKKEGDTYGKVMGIFGHSTGYYNIEE